MKFALTPCPAGQKLQPSQDHATQQPGAVCYVVQNSKETDGKKISKKYQKTLIKGIDIIKEV